MADTPFLGNFFGNLVGDEAVSRKLRARDMLRQQRALEADKLKTYTESLKGLGPNASEEAITNLNNEYGITDMGQAGAEAMAADPWHKGNAGSILGAYASAHPVKTAAGAGLGLANIGGLTDNDYYGGQIAGSLIGGLGSKFLGGGFSPMAMMAGGALGSLFDKLRQKQAESRKTY